MNNQLNLLTIIFAGCEMKIPVPANKTLTETIEILSETNICPFLKDYPVRQLGWWDVEVEIDEGHQKEHFGFYLEKDENGKPFYGISFEGTTDLNYLIIPHEHKGIPVQEIYFSQKTEEDYDDEFDVNIDNLFIPKNINKIHSYAFEGFNIKEIPTWGEVEVIGESAFAFNKITTLHLPPTLRALGLFAFKCNRISEVTLSSQLKEIYYGTFSENRINTLRIPEGIEEVSTGAFYDNYIRELYLPSSLRRIGSGAFEKNRLSQVFFEEGVLSIDAKAFKDNNLRSVILPNSLINIKEDSFDADVVKQTRGSERV